MSYPIFLSIIILVLIARLRLIFRDKGATVKDLFIIGGIPLLILPFLQFNWSWAVLFLYLIVRAAVLDRGEQDTAKINRNRALLLLCDIICFALLSSPLLELQAGRLTFLSLGAISWIFEPGPIFTGETIISFQLVLAGILLMINEMNIVLRYILKVMGIASIGSQEDKVSDEEYSMGRLIGLLERIFIFIFVLFSQYSAIGFILAAKGVTRFNNFKDDRPFAEYVLIGTLLSALLALII